MKRSSLVLAALLGLAATSAHATTLPAALPAYASPDANALVLGNAPAGAKVLAGVAPSGWSAVELPGPHTVFVAEKDTLKNFEVRPGAAYHAAPSADAPVIGLAGETDQVEFADVAGRYNKFSLRGPVTAYVRVATPVADAAPVAPVAEALPVSATVDTTDTLPNQADAPPPFADLANTLPVEGPARQDPVAAGRGVEAGEPRLARTFFGVVASTRNPLRPRRPHDYQLIDAGGARIAYLDISRLLLTERMEAYVGRPVFILGSVAPVGSSSELVIQVDSLKLQ